MRADNRKHKPKHCTKPRWVDIYNCKFKPGLNTSYSIEHMETFFLYSFRLKK